MIPAADLAPTAKDIADATATLAVASTEDLAALHVAATVRAVLPHLRSALAAGDDREVAAWVRWLAAHDTARVERVVELRAAEDSALAGPPRMQVAA